MSGTITQEKNQFLIWGPSIDKKRENTKHHYKFDIEGEQPTAEEIKKHLQKYFRLIIKSNYDEYLKLIENLEYLNKIQKKINENTEKYSAKDLTEKLEQTEIKKTTLESKISNHLWDLKLIKQDVEQSYTQYTPLNIIKEYTEIINELCSDTESQKKKEIDEINELKKAVQKTEEELKSIQSLFLKNKYQNIINDLRQEIERLNDENLKFLSEKLNEKLQKFIIRLRYLKPHTSRENQTLRELITNLKNFENTLNEVSQNSNSNIQPERIITEESEGTEGKSRRVTVNKINPLETTDLKTLQTVFISCFPVENIFQQQNSKELDTTLEQIKMSFNQALGDFLNNEREEKKLSPKEQTDRRNYILAIKNNLEKPTEKNHLQASNNKKSDDPIVRHLGTLLDLAPPKTPQQGSIADHILGQLESLLDANSFRWSLMKYIEDMSQNPEKLKNMNWDNISTFSYNANDYAWEMSQKAIIPGKKEIEKALNGLYEQYQKLKAPEILSALTTQEPNNKKENSLKY